MVCVNVTALCALLSLIERYTPPSAPKIKVCDSLYVYVGIYLIVNISDHLPPVKIEPGAPVKVEPSWESTNKELEFTGADGEDHKAPVDR